jgi:hypothetical protein
MLKYLIAARVLIGASAPALAEEYYVVRDTTTKK